MNKSDKIMMLGSCFAANIGQKMTGKGYDVCINPFGTLFNPVSIRSCIDRMANPRPFTEEECVMMGAGAGKWCSWSHYTKFARASKEEFLREANDALQRASDFYSSCNLLVVTFGTTWCFRHLENGITVANCLKRDGREFERYRLGVEQIVELYDDIDKDITLTVSPIRHYADGLHGNQISKATLLLACDAIVERNPERRHYFPSYEMMVDELRDYRFYAEDGAHPSVEAIEIIADRFLNTD